MRKTNLKVNSCSSWSIVVGDEREFVDSGNDWRKGTAKFVLPLALLLDSFLPDVQLYEAHLRRYSTPSGVASFDGALPNSSEVYGWC
jgi:hypothetical protein